MFGEPKTDDFEVAYPISIAKADDIIFDPRDPDSSPFPDADIFTPDSEGRFIKWGGRNWFVRGELEDVETGEIRPAYMGITYPNMVTQALAKVCRKEPKATINLSYPKKQQQRREEQLTKFLKKL